MSSKSCILLCYGVQVIDDSDESNDYDPSKSRHDISLYEGRGILA